MLKIAAVILAPALFWLLYHRWKDRHRPEPVPAIVPEKLTWPAATIVTGTPAGVPNSMPLLPRHQRQRGGRYRSVTTASTGERQQGAASAVPPEANAAVHRNTTTATDL